MKFEITRGKRVRPQKVVIYGIGGVGKTLLASKFPHPVFIDTENSSDHLDVNRLPHPTSWEMLLEEVRYIRDFPEECNGTLVLDTADWAQSLAAQKVCADKDWKSIEDPGYGRGYTYVTELFGELLNLLSEVCERGCNVVVTSHAIISKFEQPDEMGAYDRWSLKLIDGKKASVAAMLKEWADAVLFANYKTVVITTSKDGKVGKAQGGKNRMLYCNHAAAWDAKNRWGLPDEIPMDYQYIAPYIPVPNIPDHNQNTHAATATVSASDITPEQVEEARNIQVPFDTTAGDPSYLKPLRDLMQREGFTDEIISEAVYQRGYFPEGTPLNTLPEDFVNWLVSVWDGMRDYINSGMTGRKEQ